MTRVLQVLHCIYDDPDNPWVGGGGAVRIRQLYRRLLGRVDVTVVTGNYPGARHGSIHGIRHLRLGVPHPYALSRATYALAANALLRLARYDAAVFDFSTYTPIFMPRRRCGITVHHLTGSQADARWGRPVGALLRRLERAMLRPAVRLTATSRASQDALQPLVIPGTPVDRVQAGVPDELFMLPRQESNYLLFFGRMDVHHKGIDTVLHALGLLPPHHAGVVLKLAGRGRDTERVAELARNLGVADRVQLLGPVSDAERNALLSGALVQVMPSRFEGFGLAAAEAMAAGVPLVASTAGSLPEVVGDGGELVPPDDPHALARAITRLLDDATLRAERGEAARRWAERFRWDAVAEAHLAFLHRVAESA